jgi:ABC-type uncharacterized transport system permease subunit
MKKYWHVIGIGIQNNLTYRVNYLTRTLFSFIPLFAMLSLWRTIYAGKGQGSALGGYTQAQMIFYYLLVAVVDVLTAVNEDDWQIAADIREGNISQFLLKPIDYLWYRLCLFFSGRIAFIAMACVPLAVFIFCFRDYVVWPASGAALPAFVISLVLTALLQFFVCHLHGQNRRGRHLARFAGMQLIVVAAGVWAGAVRVAARHQKIRRVWRVNHDEVRKSKSKSEIEAGFITSSLVTRYG